MASSIGIFGIAMRVAGALSEDQVGVVNRLPQVLVSQSRSAVVRLLLGAHEHS